MKKAKHQLDLIGNPYFVDTQKNLVFDTEYDYAIHLAKRLLNRNRNATAGLNFIVSALGHGKNAELQMRKNRMERKALQEYNKLRFGIKEVKKD